MERNYGRSLKGQKGITLIALVITIVVLLILAGVSIATLTGENGLLTKASEAKIMTALGAVKEEIELDRTAKLMENKNKTVEQLLADGKVKRTVQAEGENYYMYYAIKPEAYEGMKELGRGTPASLRDVFLIDDEFHVRYIDKSGKEYGNNINNKILEDETEIRFASKAFSEYVSRISGVTETEMKFKWMKNQKKLTIDDSSIDSLEDLVFFQNLEELTLNNLRLNNLDGIENCSNIKKISVSSGKIDDVYKLSTLNNLQFIYCFNNEMNIEDVIKSCSQIDTLREFNYNAKSGTIDLNMKLIEKLNDNITRLSLRNCGITKIEGLDNKTRLIQLTLSNNKITKIEGISHLELLKELNLSSNNIEEKGFLEVYKNKSLTSLNLSQNRKINGDREEYTTDEVEKLDIINEIMTIRNGNISINKEQWGLFTGYKSLSLANSNITDLSLLRGQINLEILDLSDNPNLTLANISDIEILQSMRNLKKLLILNTGVTDVSFLNSMTSLTNVRIETIKSFDFSTIEDIISNVAFSRITQEQINTLEKCNSQKITYFSCWDGSFSVFPDLSSFTKLTRLILSNCQNITDISNIINLEQLELDGSNLTGKLPDFSKLVNLKYLGLANSYLNTNDLIKLKPLKNTSNLELHLENNSIIDASALLELDTSCKIYLGGNVNLTQESKNALKARFGSNVSF